VRALLHRVGVSSVLALAVLMWGPLATAASGPEAATISYERVQGTPGGEWSASGAINDAGTWAFDSRLFAGNSAQGFVVHMVRTFVGQDNSTITMKTEYQFTATSDPNVFTQVSQSVVTGGTGRYANLLGVCFEDSSVADFSQPVISGTYECTLH
jgi:hypothetical protein